MPAKLCAFCSHANPAGSRFCNECGASLDLNLCGNCEAINHHSAASCHKCGAELPNPSSIQGTTNDPPLGESIGRPASTTVIAAMSPATEEAIPAQQAAAVFSLRRRGAVLVALPLIAVAAVYYAYHNRGVVPPESSSVHHSAAMTQGTPGTGVSEVAGNKEARAETIATNAAEEKTQLPSALSADDGPAQIEPAPAESKPDNAPASESSLEQLRQPASSPPTAASTKTARYAPPPIPRDRVGPVQATRSGPGVSTAPLALRPSPPGAAASLQAPAACSDAVAALGLCKRNNPDEGK